MFRGDGGEPPALVAHVWGWFTELADARSSSGWGPLPISHTEIDAWMRTRGVAATPWEIGVLRALDQAHMAHLAAKLWTSGDRPPAAKTGAEVAAMFRGLGAKRES